MKRAMPSAFSVNIRRILSGNAATSSTQVLFLQHILADLKIPLDGKPGGRCGIVLDEGLLFRTNESTFVETKRKLVDECDLWCIVSLPGGVFSTAGAGVKTNLLFFTKGKKKPNASGITIYRKLKSVRKHR
jgi:type I restriction-modification system DNA methylase subunit